MVSRNIFGRGEHSPIVAFGIAALVLLLAGVAGAATVCPSGCDYTIIQAAINAANPGDTIQVESGTYYENVNVNKSLILIGNNIGGGLPVVDGSGHTAINLSAGDSTLRNFKAVNATGSLNAGIYVISNVTVSIRVVEF